MTQTKTSTGRRSRWPGPPKQAQIRLKDFANTFLCSSDPAITAILDGAMSEGLRAAMAACFENAKGASLWTDGSYNETSKTAGIGVMYRAGENGQTHTLGKSVRAAGSEEAELYAMAIGLSYLLDTFPETKYVLLRYDCTAAAVNAANIDAHAGKGAPYTNMRNAMKRCRKAGVTVVFQHVKSHAGSHENNVCDLMARYHAKVSLNRRQMSMLAPYLDRRPGMAKTREKEDGHGRRNEKRCKET